MTLLQTPGLVIDGRVMSAGRVPSAGDTAVWLSQTSSGSTG
jgi:hypothetical protein